MSYWKIIIGLVDLKILIVLTDGGSSNQLNTVCQSNVIHDDPRNVQVIAIGLGYGPGWANLSELKAIATSDDQVFLLDNFNTLNEVKDLIAETVCNAPIVAGNSGKESASLIYATVSEAVMLEGFSNEIPGEITLQLTMVGRTKISVRSGGDFDRPILIGSYTHMQPSSVVHDFSYYLNKDVTFR